MPSQAELSLRHTLAVVFTLEIAFAASFGPNDIDACRPSVPCVSSEFDDRDGGIVTPRDTGAMVPGTVPKDPNQGVVMRGARLTDR